MCQQCTLLRYTIKIVYLCCHILSCVPLLATYYVPLIQLKHFIVSLSQSLDWVPQPQWPLQIVLHYTVNELFQKVHWFINQWCGASLKTEDVPLHVLCQAVSFTRVVSCRSRFTVAFIIYVWINENTKKVKVKSVAYEMIDISRDDLSTLLFAQTIKPATVSFQTNVDLYIFKYENHEAKGYVRWTEIIEKWALSHWEVYWIMTD